jgi:hypothetical protein
MPELQRIGSLEIEDDRKFRRRNWTFERCGMAVGALLLAAVVAGFTGSGPIAKGQASEGAVTVEFDRFWRRETPTSLLIRSTGADGPLIAVSIAHSPADIFQVEEISPTPETVIALGGETRYVFRTASAKGVEIRIHLTPLQWGKAATRVEQQGAGKVEFTQWIHF